MKFKLILAAKDGGSPEIVTGVRLVSVYPDQIVIHFHALKPQRNVMLENVACMTITTEESQ